MDDGYLIQPSFPSTHPVWGGTVAGTIASAHDGISIHPPRVGWDCSRYHSQCARWHFNPPTPCGVGPFQKFSARLPFHFNPPTPCGVGHEARRPTDAAGHDFNPPTPCGVGRGATYNLITTPWISIHPPRVGWDPGHVLRRHGWTGFQSTHPVWGGTCFRFC